MDATPAAPMALTTKVACNSHVRFVAPDIMMVPVEAKIVDPDLILMVSPSLLLADSVPPIVTTKESPTEKPLAGTVKVPTPPFVKVDSVVVLTTAAPAAV